MARNDWTSDLALLLLGGAFAIASLQLNFATIHRPGPGFLPFFTASALILVAGFSLARGFVEFQWRKSAGGERLFDSSVLNVIATILILAAYAVGLEWLGYNLSTFVLFIFLFKVGGFRSWLNNLIAAFLTTSLSYLFFGFWLGVRFPKGVLGF
jgi:uncharacterized membrane protein YidH (DUF202 family)